MNPDRRRKVAEVCGWTVVQHIHGGTIGFHPISGKSEMVPNFDLSLDAIVSAIEAAGLLWEVQRFVNGGYKAACWEPQRWAKTVRDAIDEDKAGSLCLAFLAAKGVK